MSWLSEIIETSGWSEDCYNLNSVYAVACVTLYKWFQSKHNTVSNVV